MNHGFRHTYCFRHTYRLRKESPVVRFALQVCKAACVVVAIALATRLVTAEFPRPHNSETDLSRPRLDPVTAAKRFRVPEGFSVDVFAAEPDVMNPIAVAWDTQGRLWVAENYTYAERTKRFEESLCDRVLIFSDRDGDGHFDERRVFIDNVQRLTGIEVGLGGVWLICPPQLLFVPDHDGDDRPDGPPQTVLDGFTVPLENHHNFANGLRFGPDGWLYGRCGASAPGLIQRPDDPTAYQVPIRGGIWRYHPHRKEFEAVCHGTTNPWGHDWDRHGEGFFINTVNGHLWQIIPGAHYRRPHTLSAGRLVYEPIEMHADHWHFDTSKDWTDSRSASGEHDRRGGGHAHVGMTIYGGRQWPEEYQGKLFTLNQHGRRMNVEQLDRQGSGYVGRHTPDMLHAADPWMVGIEVTYGPDGSVYLIDWSDTGECHDHTGVDRNSGRIYRVSYGRPAPQAPPNLQAMSDAERVNLLADPNEWLARAARRELCNAAARGSDQTLIIQSLSVALKGTAAPLLRLRSLWTLHSLDRLSADDVKPLLHDPDEHVRTWAVRLLSDHLPLDLATGVPRALEASIDGELLAELLRVAREDPSGLVRLALASTLQRLPVAQRPGLAAALLSHDQDAGDHNIPAMIWYGLIPLAEHDPATVVTLAIEGRIPAVRVWAARRVAELAAQQPGLLTALFKQATPQPRASQADLLAGVVAGLAGQRKLPMPASWPGFLAVIEKTPDAAAHLQANMAEQLRTIGVVFADGRAIDDVRRLAFDGKADLAHRRQALESLIESQPADLQNICQRLLKVRHLNTTAMAGLSRLDDPEIGQRLAASYGNFSASEQPLVVETLASRPVFAASLLDQMAAGTIPRADVTAAQARQIRGFDVPVLTSRLGELWGQQRDSPHDNQETIDRLKRLLSRDRLAAASPSKGRILFTKSCSTCHRLFGEGGQIGPDLSGANRQNLDYLLLNIVDPSAVVTKDFLLTLLALADGRVVSGVVVAESQSTLTVQTAQNRQTILLEDIKKRAASKVSLMPDGLLQTLSDDEIAALFRYMMSESQINSGSVVNQTNDPPSVLNGQLEIPLAP